VQDDTPHTAAELPPFDRRFFEGPEHFTAIGGGGIGGKAAGLLAAREVLDGRPESLRFARLGLAVPTLTVIGTDVYDHFVERNGLRRLADSGAEDGEVARAFQRGELPPEIAGDLWGLVRSVRTPLAVRSSSLLEDAHDHPFAGVYGTKMIPNNAFDGETRFRRLIEAIKFVWASTMFPGARQAVRAAGRTPDREKMAVIIQEIVGRRHRDRFYPDVSGVGRSMNFYPSAGARREEGVAHLALGLGKTIVDGGRTWTLSPAQPRAVPPFNSLDHMMVETQTRFWAVHMGPPSEYDPTAEAEYLVECELSMAESDGTLARVASTYDVRSDRLTLGLGAEGPRVLTFAPLLQLGEWPFSEAVDGLLRLFERRVGAPVEIEFAMTFPEPPGQPARLGLLQVRPMVLPSESVEVTDAMLADPRAVVASGRVIGNGSSGALHDVLFVRRDRFERKHTRAVAEEIERFNHALVEAGRPYALVGFGRWGSSDPWLGIPVRWPQIAGVRVVVEAAMPDLDVEMSQGAHFFHNLIGFRVACFSIPSFGGARIDWDWLERLPRRAEGEWVCHAESREPLVARVDGRTGRGVLAREETLDA
jgi:hypothetical protein